MSKVSILIITAILLALAAQSSAVRAQPVTTIALPEPGATEQLYPGCNALALTFPDGTPTQTVATAVSPAGAVQAIWRHVAAQQRFEAFSPTAPQASDLLTVDFLDVVWICVHATAPPPPVIAPTPVPPPPRTSTVPPTDDDLWFGVTSYGSHGPSQSPIVMAPSAHWFYVRFENLNPEWSVCGLVFWAEVLDTRTGLWIEGSQVAVRDLAPLEAVDWGIPSVVSGVTNILDYRIVADWAWC